MSGEVKHPPTKINKTTQLVEAIKDLGGRQKETSKGL
jgi:hypothetical protein